MEFKPDILILYQSKYVKNLLTRYNKENAKEYNLPIKVGIKLEKSK